MNELEQTRLALSNLPGNRMKHPFTDEELLMIFEAFRVALGDTVMFQDVADAMDIKSRVLHNLDKKVGEFMNEKGK